MFCRSLSLICLHLVEEKSGKLHFLHEMCITFAIVASAPSPFGSACGFCLPLSAALNASLLSVDVSYSFTCGKAPSYNAEQT